MTNLFIKDSAAKVKRNLFFLCSLLSLTRTLIDYWTNNTNPSERGKRLRCWNKSLFYIEILLVPVLIALSSLPYSFKWLLIYYSFSRCNEIAYAFYRDVFRSLKQEKAASNLTSVNRIAMAMRSYVGLIFNFALLYFLIPSVNLIQCSDFFKMEESCGDFFRFIYFSGVTLTTLGYGDITPKHWLSQLLVLYEVLLGILLIVVVIATYIGGASSIDKEKQK